MSPFDDRFAAVAVDSLLDHFGERDEADEFAPVSILLSQDRQPFDWPRVIVGRLIERLVEREGRLYSREACVLSGPTAELETGTMTLPESVQVLVPVYGDTPFHVFPDECEYGKTMTRLSLIRQPIIELASFQDREGG